jgi:hypothetical protein
MLQLQESGAGGEDAVEGQGRLMFHFVLGAVEGLASVSCRAHWTHARIRDHARRFDLDDFLDEFDAAYSHGDGGRVHALQDVGFDTTDLLP